MITVTNVKKYYKQRSILFSKKKEMTKAVDNVSFEIEKGKTFGLVGESGCGKSTIAKLVTGIIKPDSGLIDLGGTVDIIFQDPYSSLNPRMTIEKIMSEPLIVKKIDKKIIEDRIKEVLLSVKLYYPGIKKKYPHEFSGGERQRIAIARSIISRPDILVLDEPVSSLDVSTQAGIVNLLKDLQAKFNFTYLFISHDLRIVEFMSDIVGVMNCGKLVEISLKKELFTAPKNEYTKVLLKAVPSIEE